MKKLLFITGISSPIIHYFIKLINTDKYEIVGLSRNKNFTLKNAKIIYGDLAEVDYYKNELADADIIIHAAAITHTKDLEKYFEVNTNYTKLLADECTIQNIKKFVYISSNTAFAENGAYAKSKFLAEQYLLSSELNYLIIRPSEVYGVKSSEGVERLINDCIVKSIIPYPTKVLNSFHPLHVADFSNIMYNSIFSQNDNSKKIININGKKPYTFLDILNTCEEILNKKIVKIPIPKEFLFLLKSLIKHFDIGIYPDQIDRLYGNKHISLNEYNFSYTLEKYINERSQLIN